MNEPIGRLGSCRPARERRTAVDTASHRLLLPDHALGDLRLHLHSFSRSPSSILSTGMPVQRETTWAIRSGVTTSCAIAPPFDSSSSKLFQLGFEDGNDAVSELAGLGEIALALRLLEFRPRPIEVLAHLAGGRQLLLLGLPALRQSVPLLLEIGDLPFELDEPVLRGGILLPSSAPRARSSAASSGGRAHPAPRAWSRPACATATRPRRPSRSPCRAGNDRRCSDSTMSPRRRARRRRCARRGASRIAA